MAWWRGRWRHPQQHPQFQPSPKHFSQTTWSCTLASSSSLCYCFFRQRGRIFCCVTTRLLQLPLLRTSQTKLDETTSIGCATSQPTSLCCVSSATSLPRQENGLLPLRLRTCLRLCIRFCRHNNGWQCQASSPPAVRVIPSWSSRLS